MRRLNDIAISDAAFDAAMAALGPFEADPHIAAGVSGGPDSMALALLLHGWTQRHGGRLTALSVNHGLRPGADDEIAQTERWLRDRGIAHAVLRWEPTAGIDGGRVQERARAARYALMEAWCAARGVLHLALGHHRQDNAETVLLRFARGSGPQGLAGMPAVRETQRLRLLRPLLGFDRVALAAYCDAADQPWIDDPSNQDPTFARPRLRRARAILSTEGLSDDTLNLTARRCAETRRAIDSDTAAALARAVTVYATGHAVLDSGAIGKPEAARAVLAAVLTTVGGQAHPPRLEKLDGAVARLAAADPAGFTLGGCLLHPEGGGQWLICREAAACDSLPLKSKDRCDWDGRFALRCVGLPPGRRCAALGEAGWRQLKNAGFKGEVPRLAAVSLPAIWHRETVECVPSLTWRLPTLPSSVTVTASFQPGTPLTAAPFAIVRG